jgi:hypothetical protein
VTGPPSGGGGNPPLAEAGARPPAVQDRPDAGARTIRSAAPAEPVSGTREPSKTDSRREARGDGEVRGRPGASRNARGPGPAGDGELDDDDDGSAPGGRMSGGDDGDDDDDDAPSARTRGGSDDDDDTPSTPTRGGSDDDDDAPAPQAPAPSNDGDDGGDDSTVAAVTVPPPDDDEAEVPAPNAAPPAPEPQVTLSDNVGEETDD